MAIKQVTIKEAIEKGYKIISVPPARRTAPPTMTETGLLIGMEVIPAIGLSMVGGIKGGAIGSGIGNSMAQHYRMKWGLSDAFSVPELVTATAAGSIALGKLQGMGGAARTGLRAGQGLGIALAEGETRSLLETGEFMSAEQRKHTMMFGGVFGGVLGAAEAKYLSHLSGAKIPPGTTRSEAVDQLDEHIQSYNSSKDVIKNNPELGEISGDINGESIVRRGEDMVADQFDETAEAANKARDDGTATPDQLDFLDALETVPSRNLKSELSIDLENAPPALKDEYHKKADILTDLIKKQADLESAPTNVSTDLPPNLQKSSGKPRFAFATPKFESGLDKALWLVRAGRRDKHGKRIKPKKELMDWLRTKFPKKTDDQIRAMGDDVHKDVKGLWDRRTSDYEVFNVPRIISLDGISPNKDAKKALTAQIQKAHEDLEEVSTRVTNITKQADEAAKKVAPGWLSGDGETFTQVDGPWIIQRLEREDGSNVKDYVLRRRIGDIIEEHGRYSDLREAQDAALKPPPAAPKPKPAETTKEPEKPVIPAPHPKAPANTGFPWFDTPTVSHKGKLYPVAKDGTADTSKAPVFWGTVGKKKVLITGVDYKGDYGVVWHRYGDFNAEDMYAPPSLSAKGKRGKRDLLNMLRKLDQNESFINQGLSALIIGGSGFAYLTSENNEAAKQAGLGGLLFWAALAGFTGAGAWRLLKTKKGKYLLKNPEAREEALNEVNLRKGSPDLPTEQKKEELLADAVDGTSQFDSKGNPFQDEKWWKKRAKDATDIIREAFQPMSRTLKGISLSINNVFRKHEKVVRQNIAEFVNGVDFVVAMEKAIRPTLRNKGDLNDWADFRIALRNVSYRVDSKGNAILDEAGQRRVAAANDKLDELMVKYNQKVIEYAKNKNKKLPKEKRKTELGARAMYEEFKQTMRNMRSYAKVTGHIHMQELVDYFPSGIKDWEQFRKHMSKYHGWDEVQSQITDEFNKISKRLKKELTPEEKAKIALDILGDPRGGVGTLKLSTASQHLRKRLLEGVDKDLIDAYVDPSEIVNSYIRRMVNAVETRNFLGVDNPNIKTAEVDVEGAVLQHHQFTDLNLRTNMEGAIGFKVQELAKEHGIIDPRQQERIQEIINARFNTSGFSRLYHDTKNLTYLGVLGNFGAAITQIGDLAYSMHFNGMGNTFKAMFNKKNWFSTMGLESVDIDLVSSRDGISKLLNSFLNVTQFQRLDKFGKNTVMQAAFFKMQNKAKKNPTALVDELAPIHGKEVAERIRKDLLSDDPFTAEVEEAIWSKFLDVQPAAQIEMPLSHAMAPTYGKYMGPIAGGSYWLKSFTLKQFDVFREAGFTQINRGKNLYREGKRKEGIEEARKGMGNIVKLAAIFAAMNASTSMVKDFIYGRKTNMDELAPDMFYRLIGISRYHTWKARREGLPSAVKEFLVPPTAVFDRVSKDLMSLSALEAPAEIYRGIAVGDFYYWHFGGGREKTRRDLAKRLGVPLEYITK